MPRKMWIPDSTLPRTLPLSISTTSPRSAAAQAERPKPRLPSPVEIAAPAAATLAAGVRKLRRSVVTPVAGPIVSGPLLVMRAPPFSDDRTGSASSRQPSHSRAVSWVDRLPRLGPLLVPLTRAFELDVVPARVELDAGVHAVQAEQ